MAPPPNPSLLADRRWLIGISISLVFGIFGGVMTLLNYADRSRSPAQVAPTTAAPTRPSEATPKKHAKGHGHN
jgi:hypothetical protein